MKNKYPNRTLEEWQTIIDADIASLVHWQQYNVYYDGKPFTTVYAEDSTDAIESVFKSWAGDRSKYTAEEVTR